MYLHVWHTGRVEGDSVISGLVEVLIVVVEVLVVVVVGVVVVVVVIVVVVFVVVVGIVVVLVLAVVVVFPEQKKEREASETSSAVICEKMTHPVACWTHLVPGAVIHLLPVLRSAQDIMIQFPESLKNKQALAKMSLW